MIKYTDKQKQQIAFWSDVREKTIGKIVECDMKLSRIYQFEYNYVDDIDDISELLDERKILSKKLDLATMRIDEAVNARTEYLKLKHSLKDLEEKWGF